MISNYLNIDLVYRLDIIIKKTNINRIAFFNILRLLNIKDEKDAIDLFNFIINNSQDTIDAIADELIKLYK